MAILDDPNREFVASTFVKLEVLPQPMLNGFQSQVDFFNLFFSDFVSHHCIASDALTESALQVAASTSVGAMDALHIAAAQQFQAVEFITTEKRTKPVYRVNNPRVISLSECPLPTTT